MNINILITLVSDSFRRGIDRLIGVRVSGGVGGTSVWGSKIGSDGEDAVESVVVSSAGVSLVVSVFFDLKEND